jgi:hypothetical protein
VLRDRIGLLDGKRKLLFRVFVVQECDAKLLEIVLTLATASRFACGLDGRQQQGYQNAYNGNDDEQFDERKSFGGSI